MGIVECNMIWLLGFTVLGGGAATLLSRGAAWSTLDPYQQRVRAQCDFARYPSLCVATLSLLSTTGSISETANQQQKHDADVIMSALLIVNTISETKQLPFLSSNVEEHDYQFISPQAQRSQNATGYCGQMMSLSLKRLNQALLALKESPTKNKQDIQTWLSASMTFQQACKATVDAQGGDLLMSQISSKMERLSKLGSNQLALVNRIINNDVTTASTTTTTTTRTTKGSGPRQQDQEPQVFPSWVSARGTRKLLQAPNPGVNANAVVAQDGTGNYKTVSEAIQAASGGRFVIYVKAGVYEEKINTNKNGITLIGDGKYATIIVGSDSVGGGTTLSGSATFTITGDGFMARDIGFQNTAGPQGKQAVALIIASDHAVLYRCAIAAYQDSLYAFSLRQFYRECDILGTIDFIFGNAAAVFQSCNLVLRLPGNRVSYNVILAQGRSDPGQNTGFAVQNCKITASSDFFPVKHEFNSYLGRAWKKYSRSVIMQSSIDDAITPRGWIEWPGTGGSALQTLYFAEYANFGPGAAATSRRAQWPGVHALAKEEAAKFTVGNFIGGSSWLPSTGVTFISGLQ